MFHHNRYSNHSCTLPAPPPGVLARQSPEADTYSTSNASSPDGSSNQWNCTKHRTQYTPQSSVDSLAAYGDRSRVVPHTYVIYGNC